LGIKSIGMDGAREYYAINTGFIIIIIIIINFYSAIMPWLQRRWASHIYVHIWL